MVACLLKWAGLGWENKSPSYSWEFGRSHKWWPLPRSSRSAHMLSLAQSTLIASPSACSSLPSSGFPHQCYIHVAYWLLGWHLVCGFCFWESFILLLLFIPPNRYLLYTSPLSPPHWPCSLLHCFVRPSSICFTVGWLMKWWGMAREKKRAFSFSTTCRPQCAPRMSLPFLMRCWSGLLSLTNSVLF